MNDHAQTRGGDRGREIAVAVAVPLYQTFDYWLPDSLDQASSVGPGSRVMVSFGTRTLVGFVDTVHQPVSCERPPASQDLKPIDRVLDPAPILPDQTRALLAWTAQYYHHPIGETVATAIPSALRQAKPVPAPDQWWTARSSDQQAAALGRAARQQAVFDTIVAAPHGISESALRAQHPRGLAKLLTALESKALIAADHSPQRPPAAVENVGAPTLNSEQAVAASAIRSHANRFQTLLLDGITGSGKTEVYLDAIADTLAGGRQVLLLAPEIGLAPQLLARLRARFNAAVGVLHSGLADGERASTWLAAGRGEINILVGTRSAVFVPMYALGLIIIDESHDAAYKQDDGLRYHARDVAIRRAQLEDIPVVLGSATPSLESLHNAQCGRFKHLRLTRRAGVAVPPEIGLIDLRGQQLPDYQAGLSNGLITRIESTLTAGGQVLLFLNRRGYAPALLCHDCGWTAHCERCNANMTWHRASRELRCHHCGSITRQPTRCPGGTSPGGQANCAPDSLLAAGQGTERLEEALIRLFPGVPQLRIDRDSTRRVGYLDAALAQASSGDAKLIIGTQMLAKGHDFPNLALVAIVDADQGLFSADFRAREHMAQLLVQVSGRAGRADRRGTVLIQTHQPEHPLLQTLAAPVDATDPKRPQNNLYAQLTGPLLAEREATCLPPFSRLALLRAESVKPGMAQQFLLQAAADARATVESMALSADNDDRNIDIWPPMPAPMPLRAGRHRAQLMLESADRGALQALLTRWVPAIATGDRAKLARQVRWSIDVDPQTMD